MARNPILDLPLTQVLRTEIALPLQGVLNVYTVGGFLKAWRNPRKQSCIEQVFDSPQQARHAAQVCANWLGVQTPACTIGLARAWWSRDEQRSMEASGQAMVS